MREILSNIAIDIIMLLARFTLRQPFLAASDKIEVTQNELILRILRENTQSKYGKKYGIYGIYEFYGLSGHPVQIVL